jgi:hypothetical protein
MNPYLDGYMAKEGLSHWTPQGEQSFSSPVFPDLIKRLLDSFRGVGNKPRSLGTGEWAHGPHRRNIKEMFGVERAS